MAPFVASMRWAPAMLQLASTTKRTRLEARVADVLFQKTHFRVALENGLYFFVKEAPHVGDDIVLAGVEIECLR